MSRVGDDGLDRRVMGENFVIGVEDRPALGEDGLLVNVLLRGEPGVLVVLDHLEIDEPERKQTEKSGKKKADQRATDPAVPLHLPGRLFETGCTTSSTRGGRGAFNRTMLCSAIGII